MWRGRWKRRHEQSLREQNRRRHVLRGSKLGDVEALQGAGLDILGCNIIGLDGAWWSPGTKRLPWWPTPMRLVRRAQPSRH